MPIDFELLFEQSPNPYMLLDRDLRYVAANAAYLRVTATRREDLLGRQIFEVFPNEPDNPNNDSVQMLRRSLERTLQRGETDVLALIRYRVPQHTADGIELADRYWSATHTPIPDADGQVAYVLQHTVDVTELQRLRDATIGGGRADVEADVLGRAQEVQERNVLLDIERSHLRGLFEQAPGFMCFLRGPEHVFEIANEGYYQLIGHREIVGKPLVEGLPEVVEQGFVTLLDQVYASGQAFTGSGVRVMLQRTPGAPPVEAYVDFIYQPIADAAGGVAGILTQGYDITLQKQQEMERAGLLERERSARAAAEAAEERQRFLAEAIPQQVWTALPNGDLDFVNTRVVEYFGAATADELHGSAWATFVHPGDVETVVAQWRHCLRTGDPYEMEFRLRRADGRYRWHLARALALRHKEDGIVKWFGTNTDMDDLTRAREELKRRAELDQQMIGIVSHDLRNPLNAIGLATALLLQRGRLDEQHVTIVRRIMSSSERAVRLIRDFLDFTEARVSGRIPVSLSPCNIREVARQVFEEVHLAYPDRRAQVLHAGEESGHWDCDRLAQLVGNLLGNAFQHGSPGGSVTLRTIGGDDVVVIEVHNDGDPIPAEDRERLFEPFQRGEHGRGRAERSVGLGLFIANQIARSHGGTIDVESTAENGTLFRVRLPRRPPDAE